MQKTSAVNEYSLGSSAVNEFPLGKGARELISIASICALLLAAVYLRTYHVTRADAIFQQPWDWHKYLYMARHNPLDFHIAPFCWRFLNSLFARLLPFGVERNFLLLTLVELFLTGVLTYYALKRWGFPQLYSLAGMLFFWGLAEATRGPLSMPPSVDQLS